MSMSAGSVTVNNDGSVVKSGMSEAIYDKLLLTVEDAGSSIPNGVDGVPAKKNMASLATRISEAIVSYITSNAEVTGETSVAIAGIQRSPISPYDPTLTPLTTKYLPTTGTIS